MQREDWLAGRLAVTHAFVKQMVVTERTVPNE